ncbi:MAG: hypothetical protein K2X80_09705 [Pseudomonadaceae bacterium]|nr:hypothetical protein [Pseudomonadaceae bacterium]
MSKVNPYLCALVLLSGFLHLGYWLLEQQRMPYGAYFSSGVAILKDGTRLTVNSRLQIQADGVNNFEQTGDWYRDFSRKTQSRFRGSFKLRTASVSTPRDQQPPRYSDEDLVFNQAYYSKKGSLLTMYRLPTAASNLCFYLLELSKLRCFSEERPKAVPPF